MFTPPTLPDAAATPRFRAKLGVSPTTLLVGVFGHLRESKRLPVVLRAMERLWQEGAEATLLVQGAFASSDLERSLAPRIGNHPRILRTGYLPEDEFWRWAAATDVCINLRFPTAAETSGIAVALMGIGKAVVFSSGEEIARIPENACLRVDPGPAEEAMLTGYLRWLTASRDASIQIGQHAALHVTREHAIEKVAAQYWKVLRSSSVQPEDS